MEARLWLEQHLHRCSADSDRPAHAIVGGCDNADEAVKQICKHVSHPIAVSKAVYPKHWHSLVDTESSSLDFIGHDDNGAMNLGGWTLSGVDSVEAIADELANAGKELARSNVRMVRLLGCQTGLGDAVVGLNALEAALNRDLAGEQTEPNEPKRPRLPVWGATDGVRYTDFKKLGRFENPQCALLGRGVGKLMADLCVRNEERHIFTETKHDDPSVAMMCLRFADCDSFQMKRLIRRRKDIGAIVELRDADAIAATTAGIGTFEHAAGSEGIRHSFSFVFRTQLGSWFCHIDAERGRAFFPAKSHGGGEWMVARINASRFRLGTNYVIFC